MSFVRTVAFWIITVVLVALFLFAGGNKLTDRIDADMHAKLVAGSAHWPGALAPILRHVEPLVGKALPNLKFTGDVLRQLVGATEVVSAVLLLLGGVLASLANLVLIVVMAGAVFTHVQLNEPFVFPAVIGALLVVLFALRSSPPSAKRNGNANNKKKN